MKPTQTEIEALKKRKNSMKPQFVIFVETNSGEIIEAFTWCRDRQSGVERARRDAKDFGHIPVKIWAEPIKKMVSV